MSTVTLAEILADINEYEHVFSSFGQLRKLDATLRESDRHPCLGHLRLAKVSRVTS